MDSRIISLLEFTLYQAFLSTILSIMIGTILAWALVHFPRFRGRDWLIAIFSSSLVLPSMVVVFGLISIYGRQGWINALFDYTLGSYLYGLFGILLAHVYLNASFASRALLHAFEAIPLEKYKVAKSLGFSVMRRFWIVEFPALKATMLGVGATIFLLCFGSFAIVLVLGGSPQYNTLEVAIYEAVRLEFDIPKALELSLLQLTLSSAFVLLASLLKHNTSNLGTAQPISWREPIMIRLFQGVIIGGFALFFISPLVAIMIDGLGADFERIFGDWHFVRSFVTSLILATLSSILAIMIALLFSHIQTKTKSPTKALLISFFGNIYLAIPSMVLGLGFFLLAQRSGISEHIMAYIALLVANILLSLPFSLSILSPLMHKSAARYDRLCASLDIKGWQRFRQIELPYLQPSLAYLFALAFCFSLGDLGVIALFGNEEISTLPWYLYGLLGSYRSSDGAGVALVMLVLVLGVFVVVPRIFGKNISK